MKQYDFVELISNLEYLKNRGVEKNSKGTIIEIKNNNALVIFFNEKNMGDYAFADVELSHLKYIGEFPKQQIDTLKTFLKDLDMERHIQFSNPDIKEYDKVQLLVEDEKLALLGINKGQTGCVISKYAIGNKVEVDFSWVDDQGNLFGECVVVNIKDLKLVED